MITASPRARNPRLGCGLRPRCPRALGIESDIDHVGFDFVGARTRYRHLLLDVEPRQIELILRDRDRHHEKLGPQGLWLYAFANQRIAKRDIDRPGLPGRTDDNPPLDANLYGETVAAQDAFTGGLREARRIAQDERRILGG